MSLNLVSRHHEQPDEGPLTPTVILSGHRDLCCSASSSLLLTPLPVRLSKATAIRKLDEKYDIQTFLGCGSYGNVWSAKCRATGRPTAVKSIRKLSASSDHEADIMRSYSQHDNLAELFEVFEDENECHIVREFCDGMDLQQHQKLPMPAEDIISSLSRALDHLHASGIAHADIRAENVIISDTGVKLIDFGAAIRPTNTRVKEALFAEDWSALKRLQERLEYVEGFNDSSSELASTCAE